ncbi:hypothetical protein AAHE18_U071700 [Arachis hypogaea]
MRSSFSPQHESDGNGSFCDRNERDGDGSGSATPRRLLLLSRTMMATAQRRRRRSGVAGLARLLFSVPHSPFADSLSPSGLATTATAAPNPPAASSSPSSSLVRVCVCVTFMSGGCVLSGGCLGF